MGRHVPGVGEENRKRPRPSRREVDLGDLHGDDGRAGQEEEQSGSGLGPPGDRDRVWAT